MKSKSVFQLKEDDSETVAIGREEVEEIVPDADFRFSLIILKDGRKLFVCGTKEELVRELNLNGPHRA